MTGLFFVVALLALLVTSVFWIWLLVLAFRVGTPWGLASLFVPFAAVVFAIRNWDECKKPFIGHLGGFVAAVVFAMLAVMSGVSAQLAEAEQTQASLIESAQPPVAVPNPSTESNEPAVAPTPPRPRPTRVAPGPTRIPSHDGLTFGNAAAFVGRLIKVDAHDGRVLKGYLVDAGRDRLVLEKDLSSGVFTFEVTRNDVKSLEIIH